MKQDQIRKLNIFADVINLPGSGIFKGCFQKGKTRYQRSSSFMGEEQNFTIKRALKLLMNRSHVISLEVET